MTSARKAVVLLSGGLDSTTVLAMAQAEGFSTVALTVRYGQRHAQELAAAQAVARALGAARHVTVDVDLGQFGGSALTEARLAVPKGRSLAAITSLAGSATLEGGAIPVTYVPARNTVLLSLALALGEVVGAFDLFIGVNALDYSGYPDCRPEFIRAFEATANVATRAAAEGRGRYAIHAPLQAMTKAEIIRTGIRLGVDYAPTHSCYDPDAQGRACGGCDACLLRKKGFDEAGVPDPTRYA